MPPPAYTSRRRLLLQLVLILILAGTLGLAAGVRHQRQNGPPVPLDHNMSLGSDLKVLVPSTWTSSGKLDIFPFVWWVQSAEPVSPKAGRVPRALRFSLRKSVPGVSAERFVRDQEQVSGGTPQPITVAGQPGVLLIDSQPTGHEGISAVHLYACTILSNDRAVMVELQLIGRDPTGRDHKLLRDAAAGIRGNTPQR